MSASFRVLLIALFAIAPLWLVACGDESDGDPTDPGEPSGSESEPPTTGEDLGSLVEVAEADGRFTTLLAAAEAANLVGLLETEGPFTVFAPTDAAFEAALAALGLTAEELLASPDLQGILAYHVVSDVRVTSDMLESGPVMTAAGLSAWVNVMNGSVRINNAAVTTADVQASNGVIHVLDAVMLPSNIVELAQYAGLDTLVTAVDTAGLVGTLSDPTNELTVFAPSDAAFAAALEALELTADELFADTELLSDILLHHVYGEAALSTELTDGATLEMFSGENASVDLGAGTVGGARLDVTDIVATNGVIHTLLDVMVPPSLTE